MKSKLIIIAACVSIGCAVFLASGNSPVASSTAISAVKKMTTNTLATVTRITKGSAAVTAYDDQASYEAKLTTIIEQLPTLNRASEPVTDSESQIHGFQSDEFIEGHMLAQLRNLSLENEKFISSTQAAYATCAERSDLANSVRAVCFMRAMEISIKLNNPQLIVDLNVPAEVRRLALQLVN